MDRLVKIAEFYKNIKTNLTLEDQLKQLKEVFPLVWGNQPLFYFDFNENNLLNLNSSYQGNKLLLQNYLDTLNTEIANFPLKAELKNYIIFYTLIEVRSEKHGILFTFAPIDEKELLKLENHFARLSLLIIQNALKYTYYQFNQLSSYIYDLEKICLSTFNISTMVENVLLLLKNLFPDFQHNFYYFEGENIIEYGLETDKTQLRKIKIINPIQKKEILAILKTIRDTFLEADHLNVFAKISNHEKDFAILSIKSPYYHFWNENTKVYYEILISTLAQAFSRIDLFHAVEDERRQLEELIQFKKDITSMIAHDLISPLMGIMGYLGIIRGFNKDFSPSTMDYINKSYRLALRLNKLIEDFRLLNQLDANKLHIHPQPIELNSYVENILKFYKDLYPAKFHINSNTEEIVVEIDPEYFSRIFENLINNSIKYVGEDVEIFIKLSDLNDKILIDFFDNGPGISTEETKTVFEKYKRGKQKNKQVGGSGLGLYICKTITELHKGKIRAENKDDGYTHFLIEIPTKRE